MPKLRELPAPAEGGRIETGPLRVGNDWAGVFVRGDNACHLAMQLGALRMFIRQHHPVMTFTEEHTYLAGLERAISLLESCNERAIASAE